MDKIIFHPEFVTATIYEWHALLKKDEFKQIIIDSLKFLVKEDRIILYAYCLMDTHIHLIWQVKGKWLSSQVRRDFPPKLVTSIPCLPNSPWLCLFDQPPCAL